MLKMAFRLLLVAFSCAQFCVGQQVIPLTDDDKRSFVDTHNSLRKGEGATDMQIIQWNDELQKFAEKVAARCAGHSGEDESTNLAGFWYVGENLAMGEITPKQAVEYWFNEKSDYNYNTGECAKDKDCGHYTQVVWAKTTAIGCGMANCPQSEYKKWIACNYGPGGNVKLPSGVMPPPYATPTVHGDAAATTTTVHGDATISVHGVKPPSTHGRGVSQYSMNTHLALVWVFVTCWYFMCQ